MEIMLSAFIKQHDLPEEFKRTVKQYYQPLAEQIFMRFKQHSQTYFVGINGCQGSGKSTLTDFIAAYLTKKHQLNVVVMSLDDFYLSRAKREQLAQKVHPLLATRGVPGTHDVAMLSGVLSKLKNQQIGFSIPKFNKATDEPCPQEQWTTIEKAADIIILEGWCWGVKPQTAAQLAAPINELEFQHDSTGVWRNYVNTQLSNAYEPLYEKMDFWLALQAPSFDCVYKWRLEQEQKLKDKNIELTNSKIMLPAEVLNFTQYFQRLSVQGCKTISQSADAVFYLDNDRKVTDTPNTESV
jgi:D-glycerate 3-kinase